MDPRIVTAEEWLVVGMSFHGDPFEQASEAFERMERNEHFGKIILSNG